MTIILVHPSYDELTKITNDWAKRAKVHCRIGRDLEGAAVTEDNLRACLKDLPDADLVGFYGHGTQESLINQGKNNSEIPVIHIRRPGVSAEELTGRNIYAVACNAGSKLGPALGAAGSQFVGYKKKFFVVQQFEEEYGEVVNRGLISWAVGGKTRSQIRKQLRNEWSQLSNTLEDQHLRDVTKERFRYLGVAFAMLNGVRVCTY